MHKPVLSLPWEPIDQLSTVTKDDILILRSGDQVIQELYRYYGAPDYIGLFKPEVSTSNHSFQWPRTAQMFGCYYDVTHFLRIARSEKDQDICNPDLHWIVKHGKTKPDYAFRVVADTQVEPKLYRYEGDSNEAHRWAPCNGYGKHLYAHWVTRSLIVSKYRKERASH